MYKCGICGKECKDITEYVACATTCSTNEMNRIKLEEERVKQTADYIKRLNADLEELKRMKTCYEGLLSEFKAKHPDAYKLNFQEKCNCGGSCKCNNTENNDADDDFLKLLQSLPGTVRVIPVDHDDIYKVISLIASGDKDAIVKYHDSMKK